MWVYQVYHGHGLLAQPRSCHFFTCYLMAFPLDARSAGLVSESRLEISRESFCDATLSHLHRGIQIPIGCRGLRK